MVKKYRLNTKIVEAIEYTNKNGKDIERWTQGKAYTSPVLEPTKDNPIGEYLQIKTSRGFMTAIPGDFIVNNSEEFYPIPKDIFKIIATEITQTK